MARTATILRIQEVLILQAIADGNYFIDGEVPSGTINGSNVTFTIANTPETGSTKIYRNGIRLRSGANNDYIISGTTITTSQAPESGDSLIIDYRKSL